MPDCATSKSVTNISVSVTRGMGPHGLAEGKFSKVKPSISKEGETL